MHRNDRTSAMLLAECRAEVQGAHAPEGMAHPGELRRWFNEQTKDAPPAPELAFSASSKLTASIEQVAPVAAKVNKLNAPGVAGIHDRA